MNFSADAYEELPISTETVFSTTGRGKRKVTTATNRSAAEDNGFLTTLDIPVQHHITRLLAQGGWAVRQQRGLRVVGLLGTNASTRPNTSQVTASRLQWTPSSRILDGWRRNG